MPEENGNILDPPNKELMFLLLQAAQ